MDMDRRSYASLRASMASTGEIALFETADTGETNPRASQSLSQSSSKQRSKTWAPSMAQTEDDTSLSEKSVPGLDRSMSRDGSQEPTEASTPSSGSILSGSEGVIVGTGFGGSKVTRKALRE